MSIVLPLHARVHWPFQGGASFADPFCYLCFLLVFVMPACLFLAASLLPDRRGWPLVCGIFLCFVAFRCGILGREWCLIVSIPDSCLLVYFD